jgi:hypothetical protein
LGKRTEHLTHEHMTWIVCHRQGRILRSSDNLDFFRAAMLVKPLPIRCTPFPSDLEAILELSFS